MFSLQSRKECTILNFLSSKTPSPLHSTHHLRPTNGISFLSVMGNLIYPELSAQKKANEADKRQTTSSPISHQANERDLPVAQFFHKVMAKPALRELQEFPERNRNGRWGTGIVRHTPLHSQPPTSLPRKMGEKSVVLALDRKLRVRQLCTSIGSHVLLLTCGQEIKSCMRARRWGQADYYRALYLPLVF